MNGCACVRLCHKQQYNHWFWQVIVECKRISHSDTPPTLPTVSSVTTTCDLLGSTHSQAHPQWSLNVLNGCIQHHMPHKSIAQTVKMPSTLTQAMTGNGLLQGSVLQTPTLFNNLYTVTRSRRFIYAEICCPVQAKTFAAIECMTLSICSSCAVVSWTSSRMVSSWDTSRLLDRTSYLYVALDHTILYKASPVTNAVKLRRRSNLICKLACTTSGANAHQHCATRMLNIAVRCGPARSCHTKLVHTQNCTIPRAQLNTTHVSCICHTSLTNLLVYVDRQPQIKWSTRSQLIHIGVQMLICLTIVHHDLHLDIQSARIWHLSPYDSSGQKTGSRSSWWIIYLFHTY